MSTYDLGHQPFGLASPAAWLRARGHEVVCADTSIGPIPDAALREAGLIAFFLPMHTATRLAIPWIERARKLNPAARLCCYGLYAALNRDHLLSLGVDSCFGGEFETSIAAFAGGAADIEPVSLARQNFLVPDRASLPALPLYPRLVTAAGRVPVAYTEASRGCKHLCRHCPVVPVYRGVFRIVSREVVLADIRQQIAAGARHVTFGDPDFFNGPAHARRIVEALHREFPSVTYDATIKIEHLRQHRALLPILRDTGCLFITSAVESVDDSVLARLDKGHTRADFFAVASDLRALGLTLSPTFIPFNPWTTRDSYLDLLASLRELDLIESASPVQLALRLLVPAHSRLLELDEIRACLTGFDAAALLHRWRHADPSIDELAAAALRAVQHAEREGASRREIFHSLWNLAGGALPCDPPRPARATIPFLEEPWYC